MSLQNRGKKTAARPQSKYELYCLESLLVLQCDSTIVDIVRELDRPDMKQQGKKLKNYWMAVAHELQLRKKFFFLFQDVNKEQLALAVYRR